MANRFCNLDGNAKIKDEYGKINIGFDKVENEIDDLNSNINAVDNRVNEIITTPADGVSAQEIIDARHGEPTLGAKIADIEHVLDAHKAENVANGVHGLSTTSNITYTISPTGDDSTGDGTVQNPFATIKKAISLLPPIISHDITINLIAGVYVYDEGTINIRGYTGSGTLTIKGAGIGNTVIERSSQGILINSVQVKVKLSILDIHVIYTQVGTDYRSGLVFNSSNVLVKNCKFSNMGRATNYNSHVLAFVNGSSGRVENCSFINCSNCITSGHIGTLGNNELLATPSDIFSKNNTSSNDYEGYGLVSYFGTIRKEGTQPTGKVANELVAQGGQII